MVIIRMSGQKENMLQLEESRRESGHICMLGMYWALLYKQSKQAAY